ncbi:MAG: hypothetical protein A3D33_06005 [Candidatus Rokubacteria bacterium RIFCSPHIGHO2_02_FULL_73_26]|nr:MAG: hypothetical protein A3D33_06005 [Candidatus Rokubacteria bacterium RIFCSPHIGHO2_02_FULL_73_26]
MRSAPSVSPSAPNTTKRSRSEPVISSRPPSLPIPTSTAGMNRPAASRGTPCRATSGSSVRSQPAASVASASAVISRA